MHLPHNRNASTLSDWLPVAVLGICTIVFLCAPTHSDVPTTASPEIDPALLDTSAARIPLGNPPITTINGFKRDCQDCHSIFKSNKEHNDGKLQHANIRLQHGMNSDCLNCHLESDRNKLRLHGNKSITFDKSEMLCAQCHGTTYRDWSNGSHGRVFGSWIAHSEERQRLTCVACHDPHSPTFPGISPLPGPQTLRMGPVHEHEAHYRSSLMQWLNTSKEHSDEHSPEATREEGHHHE